MKTISLDGSQVHTPEDLHALLAEALALPHWYGRNLDALYDCLTDVGEDTTLVIQNKSSLEANLGPQAVGFLRVLTDAAAENQHLSVTLE